MKHVKWWIPVVIFFVIALIAFVTLLVIINRSKCPNNANGNPQFKCAGTCVDTQNDPKNCLKCGNNCGTDETTQVARVCIRGLCQNPS